MALTSAQTQIMELVDKKVKICDRHIKKYEKLIKDDERRRAAVLKEAVEANKKVAAAAPDLWAARERLLAGRYDEMVINVIDIEEYNPHRTDETLTEVARLNKKLRWAAYGPWDHRSAVLSELHALNGYLKAWRKGLQDLQNDREGWIKYRVRECGC